MTKKTFARIFEEPYRIFFPLAVFCGMLGIGHWIAYAAGWIDRYSGFMHASIQMQVSMICFIAGFLMTAGPRMSATAPASRIETCRFLSLILGMLVFLILKRGMVANLLFMVALGDLFLFGFRRRRVCHDSAKVVPPVEFIWVPLALLHGILGSLLLIAGTAKAAGTWAILCGKAMVQQGLVLAIVLGVGGFLAPRLMGTFKVVKHEISGGGKIRQAAERRRYRFFHLSAGSLLLSSFFLEGFGLGGAAYGFRAILVTAVMIWTRSLVFKPLMPEQYVRLLWLSLWMVFFGSWTAFLFPNYRVAMLHFVFLGGYSLMTFAVATMMILSYSGRKARLGRSSKVLSFVALSIGVSTISRVISALLPQHAFLLLCLSSMSWLSGAAVWLLYFGPLAFVFADKEKISREHEEAKRTVLKMREAGA